MNLTYIKNSTLITLLASVMIISLNGCAATAIGATATYITDPRSSSQISNDHDIKSAVKDAINKDLPKNNIEVTSYQNTVLLTGQIMNKSDSELATKIATQTATQISNKAKIYNKIKIDDADYSSYMKDSYITSKVKANALFTVGIDSNSIKIITSDRIVYLLGSVSKPQSERIIELTKAVSNVKNVVPLFEPTV